MNVVIFHLHVFIVAPYSDEGGSGEDGIMVRDILFSSRENINFIHELFRQALCLSFRYAGVMKTVIFSYKDWIQMNVSGTCYVKGHRESEGSRKC